MNQENAVYTVHDTYKEELDAFLGIFEGPASKRELGHVGFTTGAMCAVVLVMKAINKNPTIEAAVAALLRIRQDAEEHAPGFMK